MANKVCIIESDKIVDGTNLMKGNTDLVKWDSDLSSLTNGYMMFVVCSNLTSFSSDLSSLTNGYMMFVNCENLTSFSSDLSSLTNGHYMFAGCKKLTSFDSDLNSLTNGEHMFTDCKLNAESLKKIAISLPKTDISGTRMTISLEADSHDNGDGTQTPDDIKNMLRFSFNKLQRMGII